MKTVRMKIDVLNPTGKLSGRIDPRRVDATTEADIARHKAADDADAMLDAAKFARRGRRHSVRRSLLSVLMFPWTLSVIGSKASAVQPVLQRCF
jgi:hypothetical protein